MSECFLFGHMVRLGAEVAEPSGSIPWVPSQLFLEFQPGDLAMYLPGQLGVLEEVGGSPPEVTCPSRSGHIIYTPTSLLRKLKPGEAAARGMAFSGPQSWKLIEVESDLHLFQSFCPSQKQRTACLSLHPQ